MTDKDRPAIEQTLLQVGDYLHASCSDAIYGEVIGLGTDANGFPCVDLRIFDAEDLLSWPDADSWPDFHGLATLELPPGDIILRGLHYRGTEDRSEPGIFRWGKAADSNNATHGDDATHVSTGRNVEVLTPGHGCYRCTRLFNVARRPV